MNDIKKQLCLIFVCSTLIMNHVVAMDGESSGSSSFSPGHRRSNSASKAEIISLDSPSSSRLVRLSPKKKDGASQPLLIMLQNPSHANGLGEEEKEFLAAKTRATDTSTRLLGEQMQFSREQAEREREIVNESLALKKQQLEKEQELLSKSFVLKAEQSQHDSELIAAQIAQLNANTQSIIASINRENTNSTWSEALTSPAFWKPVITGAAVVVTEATLNRIIKWGTADSEVSALDREISVLDRTNTKKKLIINQKAIESLEDTVEALKAKMAAIVTKIKNGEELSAPEYKTLEQGFAFMQRLTTAA